MKPVYEAQTQIYPSHHGNIFNKYIFIERNINQIHKLRRQFESERKANRNNFYKSIIYNSGSADKTLESYNRNSFENNSLINPKWGKSLMPKFEYTKEGRQIILFSEK